MTNGKIVNTHEVLPFRLSDAYSSKMLLDDIVAGGKSIHINEGTLSGGCNTLPGAAHKATEIYYVVKGRAVIILDDERFDIGPGSVVYIPPGCVHALENKSETDDFVLLTLWENTEHNEVYHQRVAAWGTSFRTIND